MSSIPVISPSEVLNSLKSGFSLIDVRSQEEFTGELGHIDGARLVTLGPELDSYLESVAKTDKIIFICRSGKRSESATAQALSVGVETAFNMTGGMMLWNDQGYEVEK